MCTGKNPTKVLPYPAAWHVMPEYPAFGVDLNLRGKVTSAWLLADTLLLFGSISIFRESPLNILFIILGSILHSLLGLG